MSLPLFPAAFLLSPSVTVIFAVLLLKMVSLCVLNYEFCCISHPWTIAMCCLHTASLVRAHLLNASNRVLLLCIAFVILRRFGLGSEGFGSKFLYRVDQGSEFDLYGLVC